MPLSNTNIQTLLLFSTLFTVVYCLARSAEKRPQKAKTYIFVIITLLSLVCGLRGVDVGRDTVGYLTDMENYMLGYAGALKYYEIGFRVFIEFIISLTGSRQSVFFIAAFITVWLIVVRLWEMRSSASFSLSMVFFSCIVYSALFSGFRQWLAVSIVFFASRYIEKKEYLLYVIIVIIATTIHFSALIGIIPFGMFFLFSIQMRGKMAFKSVIIVVGVVVAVLGLNYMNLLVRFPFNDYFTGTDIGFMILSRPLLFILIVINYYSMNRKNRAKARFDTELSNRVSARGFALMQYFPYVIGCILGGLYGNSIDRVTWYFKPFECALFAGNYVDKQHWSYQVVKTLIVIITFYSFYSFVVRGIPSLTPYEFFWE